MKRVISFGPALVFAIACLPAFSCYSQTVIAWNAYGNISIYGETNVPPEATNVIDVAAGFDHSLALRGDGTVVSWGKLTEVPSSVTNAIAVSAGKNHSVALRRDGTVVAWGDNSRGQLGVPSCATNIISIAAACDLTFALREDGKIVSWGPGYDNQANPFLDLSNIIAISANATETFVTFAGIRKDGTGVIWSASQFLFSSGGGFISDISPANSPNGIAALLCGYKLGAGGELMPPFVSGGSHNSNGELIRYMVFSNVVTIACGSGIDVGLLPDGTVRTFWKGIGAFVFGDKYQPSNVTNIIAVSAGREHVVALQAKSLPPRIYGPDVTQFTTGVGSRLPIGVRAAGVGLSYQWYRDGVAIPGATNAFPQLSATVGSDSAEYRVVVSNAFGSLTSAVSQVTVSPINLWGNTTLNRYSVPTVPTDSKSLAAGGFHGLVEQKDGKLLAWAGPGSDLTNCPPEATNISSMKCGVYHNLVLRRDGTVVAWGRNDDGETDVPTEATNVVAVAGGNALSLAVRADGRVLAWGNNGLGQTNVPLNLTNAIDVAAGTYHCVALRSNHTVVGWGSQSYVPNSATNVVAIAAGSESTLALRADGTVIAWGDNTFGQTSVPSSATNVVAIAAGWYHSMALRADGTVVAWGTNYYGITNVPFGLCTASLIAAGEDHCVAIEQQGPPEFEQPIRSEETRVGGQALFVGKLRGAVPSTCQWHHNGVSIPGATSRFLLLSNVQASDAGTYVLTVANAAGQITSEPANLTVLATPGIQLVQTNRNVVIGMPLQLSVDVRGSGPILCQWQRNGRNLVDDARVHGANSDSLSIDTIQSGDGGVYSFIATNQMGAATQIVSKIIVSIVAAWGDNSAGQTDIPDGVTNVMAIAGGGDHSLALKADGKVIGWGDNTFRQNLVPPAASDIVAIAEGGAHSLALRADGTVIAWGDNTWNQTNVPPEVTHAIAIAAGENQSMALLSDGTVVLWGGGTWTNFGTYPISGTAIAAGENYSMVIDAYGSVQAWGDSAAAHATNVSGLTNCNRAIAAGADFGLALQNDTGSLIAWGVNRFGQTDVPSAAVNLISIAGGGDHAMGLRSDGKVIAWGANYSRQTEVPSALGNVVAIAAGGCHSLALVENGGPLFRRANPGSKVVLGGALGGTLTNCQWQCNGTNIPGATTSTLTIDNVSSANSGIYRLIVYNSNYGSSQPISLFVPSTELRFDISRLLERPAQIRVLGSSGEHPVVIYASPNLVDWETVLVAPPTTQPVDYLDESATNSPMRFYRAEEAP